LILTINAMNDIKLTKEDLQLIKESLQYTKLNFENYQNYPSHDFKNEQIKRVQDLLVKVSNLLKT
jgi:membrane-bound lytic murein transglycosylase MltF